MSPYRPPRFLERLLVRALPNGLSGQGTLGDLAEGFEQRAVSSALRARIWYTSQAVSILAHQMFSKSEPKRSRRDSDLMMDIRWSSRIIRKNPRFSLTIVLVLGLGLGANTAVFSVVDGTLKNTSWWRDPAVTVAIWPENPFSFGHTSLYNEEQTAYDVVGGYTELAFALNTPNGESVSINGVSITPALFRELAVQPVVGRPLADDDATFGAEPVVVIGDGLWRRSFDADPDIIGSRIQISGQPVTVVGVQGRGGTAPGGRAEIWVPWLVDPRDDDYWKSQSHTLIGVLKDGANLNNAQEDLAIYTDRLSTLFPNFYAEGWADGRANVSRADAAQRRLVSTPLLLLLAGTALLMFVTALNVGNLLLGRAIDRRRELAVRTAIGAGRRRIIRQLLVEGFVLTGLSLAVGLASAAAGGRWIAALFVEQPVVASSSILSPRVTLFALGISMLAWVVLNGVPIIHFLRTSWSGVGVSPDSGAAVQRALVTGQAALATLLLVSAALFVATVDNLRRVPLGFEPEGVVTIEMSPPQDRVATPAAARQLYDGLVEAVSRIPGVQSVGLTGWLPLRAQANVAPINPQSAPVDPRESIRAPKQRVDPGFFATFGIEATAGRVFGLQDRNERIMMPGVDPQASAVVISQSLADQLWPDGNALGQRIAVDPHAWDVWAPVVGIVPDIRTGSLTGPMEPVMYVPLAEVPTRDFALVIRTDLPSSAIVPAVREAVRNTDALVPIRAISTMSDVVLAAYATSWVMMGLLIVLAVIATILGAIGIYAVLAHYVALNKREIGVRMALGAQPGRVVGGIVRYGLILAGIGIAIGSAAAAMSTRFIESLLYEVSALAPTAFLAPAVTLGLAAALAAWIPAARAGRLPPADVLRSE